MLAQEDIFLTQNKAKIIVFLLSGWWYLINIFTRQSKHVPPFQFQTSYWCSFRTCLQGCIIFLNYEALQPLLGFQCSITHFCSVVNLCQRTVSPQGKWQWYRKLLIMGLWLLSWNTIIWQKEKLITNCSYEVCILLV